MTWQALVCATALLLTAPAMAMADSARFNIAAQPLPTALKVFAEQAKMQLLYQPGAVDHAIASPIVGDLDKHAALEQLLRGTGLEAIYSTENAATIRPIRAAPTTETSSSAAELPPVSSDRDGNTEEGKKGFLNRFRVAQVDQGTSSSSSSVEKTAQASQRKPEQLEEVVVTAQKQGDQNLKDVPIPISVLNGDQLADTSQVLLKDYAASVPGLNLLPATNGISSLSIRGITTGIGNSTVAILVDGVSYGDSTDLNEIPDIDPGDLARIEVLRGPQGTLYGDNSMGGLINYVTKQPSFTGFSGRVETGTDWVTNGAEPGYNLRASANIPINDQLAIRISGFQRQDAGYIDNPLLHEKGVNEANAYGGKFALLWQVMPDTSVAFSALGQYTKQDGLSYIEPGLGGLRQDYAPNSGYDNRSVQAYSLTVKTKIGGINVTSLTGYNVGIDNNSVDFTEDLLGAAPPQLGATATPLYSHFVTEKVTQELRLNGTLFNNIDWLVGGFYTHEHSPGYQTAYASDALTGNVIAPLGTFEEHGDFEEYAGFANVTYHFTDRFDIQVGGRETHVDVTMPINTYTGVFASINPATTAPSNVFTYLVTPQFNLNSDLMVYARLASGFRPGSANSAFVISQGAPAAQMPDKTEDYEIGVKGEFFDKKLSIDASAYYIDWQKIQLIESTFFTINTNGAAAKSEGVDFSFSIHPTSGFTIGGWVAYDDAVLTENLPVASALLGLSGSRLPFTPRLSSTVSAEQQFPLSNNATGFVGGQVEYVGDRIGTYEPTTQRQVYPSYTRTDLRAGMKYDEWTFSVYANNVGDVRAPLNGGIGSFVPKNGFIYITPRTVGLNIARNF